MVSIGIVPLECVPTGVANVGLLACVYYRMFLQTFLVFESHSTLIALEWFVIFEGVNITDVTF